MEQSHFDFAKHGLKHLDDIAQTHDGQIRIYQVKNIETKEWYALKVISKSYFTDQTKIQYVYNEKNALLELDHPGIVKLNKTLKDDNDLCFLLELVYGCPVHKIIQLERRANTEFVKLVGIQLALILNYIHSKGYVYRDIKASNVIVNQDGRAKIVDLGYAKKIEKGRTKSFCGTLHAMAPEFFKDLQEGYGYEVDYYAFGILLYEMVVGSPPFGYETEKDDVELKKEIKEGIKPSHLEKVSDKKLRDLIEKLLEKDKEKRLGSKDGFNEIIKHPFFEDFVPKEVEDFIAAKEDSEVPFQGLQARCDLYLETAYLSGIRPENPYDADVDDDNDPFKEF